MKLGQYVVAELSVAERGDLEGKRHTPNYTPDYRYGYFDKPMQAKASLARSLNPELNSASDEFAALHFDQMARNLKHFKIIKVSD